LQSLTTKEKATFSTLNAQYRQKCNFPFILAVRNVTKYTVLAALSGRAGKNTSVEQEFVIAMEQVHKIAWMRLLSKLNTDNAKGFLTCHVLDTANGCPGMCVFKVVCLGLSKQHYSDLSAFLIALLFAVGLCFFYSTKHENRTTSSRLSE
jgi:hypothetical protein